MLEMATHWWSILCMLQSLITSHSPIVLALAKPNKNNFILEIEEISRVNVIIKLLEYFKCMSEQLRKKGFTITIIAPMFQYLKKLY